MRLVLLAIQMCFLALPLAAVDSLSRYVPADALARLRTGGHLSASISANGSLTLLPSIASRDDIFTTLKTDRPNIGVEVLQLIRGSGEQMDGVSGWLKIYNAMHAVSTMKGIKYYSTTWRAERVLFSESFVVQSADTTVRVSDPMFSAIPTNDVLYSVQQDSSFGRNTYQESFGFRSDHLVVKIENLTTISLLLIPFIQPRCLVSDVVLVPVGKDVLFYGMAYAKTSAPLGNRQSRQESLGNRLIAMASWLQSELTQP